MTPELIAAIKSELAARFTLDEHDYLCTAIDETVTAIVALVAADHAGLVAELAKVRTESDAAIRNAEEGYEEEHRLIARQAEQLAGLKAENAQWERDADQQAHEIIALQNQVAALRTALGPDASGRSFHDLLVVAADLLAGYGGGPVEDCLRLKAGAVASPPSQTTPRTCVTTGHVFNSAGCVFCRTERCRYSPPGTSARCVLGDGHGGDHDPRYVSAPPSPPEATRLYEAEMEVVACALAWEAGPHGISAFTAEAIGSSFTSEDAAKNVARAKLSERLIEAIQILKTCRPRAAIDAIIHRIPPSQPEARQEAGRQVIEAADHLATTVSGLLMSEPDPPLDDDFFGQGWRGELRESVKKVRIALDYMRAR